MLFNTRRFLFFLCLAFSVLGTIATRKSPVIEKITLDALNCMDRDEFSYLTDLQIGSIFSPDLLAKAKEILEIKKRFKRITFDYNINPKTNGVSLTCHLEPNIIIKKIKIRGGVHAKSAYEHLYHQQPGTTFSPEIHRTSLKAIKDRLAYDGYLKGSVTSSLKIDEKSKTVAIYLTLDTGPRFFITNINLALNLSNLEDKKTASHLITNNLQGIFNPFIRRYQYNQEKIKKWAQAIKSKTRNLGFLKPRLKLKVKIDYPSRTVHIFFILGTTTQQYLVQGNTHASTSEILASFTSHLVENKPLQTSIIKHQIRQLYQTKGYWKPEISISQTRDTCIILVDEGAPSFIKQILLEAPHKKTIPFPYSSLIKCTSKTRCSRGFIKQHLQKVIQTAIKNGFWDCKITSTRLVYIKDAPNECILKIVVAPGEQRLLGGIHVNKPNDPEIKHALQLLEGHQNKPFDPQILTETRRKILGSLYQQGYWYSAVDYTLRTDPTSNLPGKVELSCNIDPGERVVFGKLITQGHTKLPFKKILKNCNFPEGTVWDQKKIDSSRVKLHHLEIFDHVKFSPYQLTTPRGNKHIIASILDDDPYEARIKIGFLASNDKPFLRANHTAKLAGSYRVKNPLNKADMFIIGAQADSTEQQVTVQYSVPELLGSNQVNSFALATENRRYMFNLTEPVETVVERRTGFSISAQPVTVLNESQFGWSAGIDSSKLLGYHGNMNLDPMLTEKSLFFIYAEPTFKRISIDEKKSMSEGVSTEATARFLLPFVAYGNAPLLRICFKQRFSKNFHNLLGLLFTFRYGHIFSDNPFSSIHPNDRFYLGGADTIRGYSKDTLPPLGPYTTADGKTGYTVQGGKSLLQINIELRHRISKNTELQFFHDLGSLAQDSSDQLLSQMYRTIGTGTRIYTPVGIVKFDIGYKLSSSYPDEHSYNWHLSFDGSF